MKNLFLVLLVAVMVMVSSFEAKACVEQWINIDIDDGCVYPVLVCITCSEVAHIFELEILEYANVPCARKPYPTEAVANKVFSEETYRRLCGSTVPPCNEGGIEIIGTMYDCHTLVQESGGLKTINCENSGYCKIHMTMCWDAFTSSYVYIDKTVTHFGPIPTCPYNENPQLGDPCFRLWTPCDDIE